FCGEPRVLNAGLWKLLRGALPEVPAFPQFPPRALYSMLAGLQGQENCKKPWGGFLAEILYASHTHVSTLSDSDNSPMLLTITSTHQPATDLGYLLHKNPAKLHSFELSFGKAHVFYPRRPRKDAPASWRTSRCGKWCMVLPSTQPPTECMHPNSRR